MLPPKLGELKYKLEKRGALRTVAQDEMLAELQEIDSGLDQAKQKAPDPTKSIEKRGNFTPGVLGGPLGRCPVCGGTI